MEMQASHEDAREPWLIYAMAGLGLCLGCEQYERYYAVWSLDVRTFNELFLIVALTGAVLLAFSAWALRSAQPLYTQRGLLAALALAQTFGVIVLIAQREGLAVPASLTVAAPLLRQAGFLLLVLYAQFFLSVGIRKSVRALAWGLVISGGLQTVCSALPAVLVLPLIVAFMPAAAVLLGLAYRTRPEATRAREREDISAEIEASRGLAQSFSFWECCISIVLVNVLLITLHNRGIVFQDGGTASVEMQLSAGIGCIITGIAFLALLNYLQEAECVDLLRVTILPVVLIALYFSATISVGAPSVYFVPLCICYSMLLLLVWTTPRYYQLAKSSFLCVCVAFFSFKLGWALGLFGVMIAPTWWGETVEATFVFLAYTVLLLFSAFHAIRTWRMNSRNKEDVAVSSQLEEPSGTSPFEEACNQVTEEFSLTPREAEVLLFLARGRNARFISEALVISDGTARTHIMHIYQKLEVNSQQELIDIVDAHVANRV